MFWKKQIFERANVSPKLVNNFLRNLLRAKFSLCVEKSIKRIVELSGHFWQSFKGHFNKENSKSKVRVIFR